MPSTNHTPSHDAIPMENTPVHNVIPLKQRTTSPDHHPNRDVSAQGASVTRVNHDPDLVTAPPRQPR